MSIRQAQTTGFDCTNCGKTTTTILFVPKGATFYKAKISCGYCHKEINATIPVDGDHDGD